MLLAITRDGKLVHTLRCVTTRFLSLVRDAHGRNENSIIHVATKKLAPTNWQHASKQSSISLDLTDEEIRMMITNFTDYEHTRVATEVATNRTPIT